MSKSKATRHWLRSFYLSAIAWRYLLTPIGTIRRIYYPTPNQTLSYTDVYIFGIRIARINTT